MTNKKYYTITAILVIITAISTFILTTAFNAFVLKALPISTGESAKLQKIKSLIEEKYYKDADIPTVEDGAYRGVIQALGDPYSTYMDNKEYNEFKTNMSGSFSGIGVTVDGDAVDNRIIVVAPIEGTPAERAGLSTGDKIIKVDNEDVWGDKLDYAVSKIKGEIGTNVTLDVLKYDTLEIVPLIITREKITIKTVRYSSIGNLGYIRITNFEEHTAEEFSTALEEIKAKSPKGLILDLRSNPGGLLEISERIADKLMPEGVITYLQYKDGKKEYSYSDSECYDVPVAIIINGGSASASEVVSGALKDSGRAMLVGTKTFGKGVVQQTFGLDDGSCIKLTIASYYTPEGINIHGVGLQPDYEVADIKGIDITKLDTTVDLQLKKAVEILSN